jgi:hypothetical protein
VKRSNPKGNWTSIGDRGSRRAVLVCPFFFFIAFSLAAASKMDDEAEREARTIGGLAGVAQPDVVQLGAQGEVRKKTDIHAAAEAIGKLVGRAAAGTGGQTRPAKQELRKGSVFGGIAQRDAGAEEIGVGVEGNASGRSVVAAEVADDAEPAVGVIGERAADAVLVDAPGTTQAEIGVADGGVDGLGARRKGEEEQPEAKQE